MAVRAAVYHYNPGTNTWETADNGLSRLDLYHSPQNQRYRVVGVSAKTGEVVANSSLTRAVVYQQVTPLFHQWSDTMFSYGVYFATHDEAQRFAQAVDAAILHLGMDYEPPPPVLVSSASSGAGGAGGTGKGDGSGRAQKSDKEREGRRRSGLSRKDVDALRAELQQFVLREIASALGTTAPPAAAAGGSFVAPKSSRRMSRAADVSPRSSRREKHSSVHLRKDPSEPWLPVRESASTDSLPTVPQL